MNKTPVFVLGLTGSILGILGSMLWIVFGVGFFGGLFDYDMPVEAPLTETAFIFGMILSLFQSVITVSFFIVAIVKSTPFSLDKGMKSSGVWLLIIGIATMIINVLHLIPCILLIIAGALCLQGDNKSGNKIIHNDTSTNEEKYSANL